MDRVYVMELVRSFQSGQITRREFLNRATLAIGSVAAANALLAACVPAPAETPPPVVLSPTGTVPRGAAASTAPTATGEQPAGGLATETVDYPDTDGETLMGYLARPGNDEPAPAVVVIQEWWGLNEHIRDVTRRFASEGFVALAPDLYHGVTVSEPDEARKLVMELDMDEAVREIRQAIDFLQSQPYVAGQKVGIVGYCMGGRLVLQTARVEEDRGAVVAYYGSPLTPTEAQEVKAPLLGLYGAEDGGIPVEGVREMEAALDEAGITNEFHVYEGAGHAFFNDTRSSYHPEAAADAWPRTLEWFRSYLGA
jgi:carboxymethylenebutenolidase